ncbi:MAG: DNA recombination protein RmuC, partial [Actinomycetota bacterium]
SAGADAPSPEEIARRIADEHRRLVVADRDAAIAVAVGRFSELNHATLTSERARSGEELDAKKSLIDQQLATMNGELAKIGTLVRSLEAERAAKLGELSGVLEQQRVHIQDLTATTQGLREALSSTKVRGQWGERMAEDVLRLAGFIEGVNYRKQQAIPTGVPDFTFLLPDELCLHMDVKFPLDNYLRYLDATGEIEQRRARDDFLRDVRTHVKTLAARDYIDAGSGSVDCVLLFIPNEAVYAFIQEQDAKILDEALGRKLVFCSPLTLFAVLAVVRQAVDNFRVERTSGEILARLGAFAKQWGMFTEKMDKLGRSLETTRRDFEDLTSTRRRRLKRELDTIEQLRRDTDDAIEHGEPRAIEG